MRGVVDGLLSAHPLGETLPAVFRADEFAQQLCAGLDEVLAPVTATLDSLPAYLDPATAPDDLLVWLASWMGIVVDRHQSAERQRQLVRDGAELLAWRGTVRGLRKAVRALFAVDPEITDPGAATWSATAGADLPAPEAAELVVRLALPHYSAPDVRRLEELVLLVKPAHVSSRVEIRRLDETGSSD